MSSCVLSYLYNPKSGLVGISLSRERTEKWLAAGWIKLPSYEEFVRLRDSPPPAARKERMMEMCIQCGQHPRFRWRGKTYNLCAVCGWQALCKVLKLPDDASKTDEQKVAEAVDYVPFEEWAGGERSAGCLNHWTN